jgi:manganese/zinc/iron transport system permease protein
MTIANFSVTLADATPMLPTGSEWWVVATASLCGGACGLLGTYLVLRRLSMLGDALTHAILPGLASAFLLTGTRNPIAMLAGALVVGLFTSAAASGLSRLGKVQQDAALGVVFTALFAAGVIMITRAADQVDLDPGCVLYGMLETLALTPAGAVPRQFWMLAGVLVLAIAALALFTRHIKLVSFHPELATSLGVPAGLVHYAMLTLITTASVASFEAVGSILVIAMLVAPGATALLLTHRWERAFALAGLLGALAGLLGALVALRVNTSVAGAASVAAGALFVLAALFSPSRGYVPRRWRLASLALRIRREDILGALYRAQVEQRTPDDLRRDARSLARGFTGALALRQLRGDGLIEDAGTQPRSTKPHLATPRLTKPGIIHATKLLRAHRLWEAWLAKEGTLPSDHLHDPSERMEHFIQEALAEKLGAEVDTNVDPQGREIP